jgi:hypothetical protein
MTNRFAGGTRKKGSLHMFRLLRAVLAIAATALLLAACTISSEKLLVKESEGSAPLPAHFILYPYNDSTGAYVPANDPPATFNLVGKHYVSTDMADTKGAVVARFLPLGPDLFLLAVTFADDAVTSYGFARYRDGVLAMAISPNGETAKALAAERAEAAPKRRRLIDQLPVSGETDAITVKSRAALDALAKLSAAGRLPMGEPAVAYIGSDGGKPPARISAAREGWKLTP